jgi:ATP-binding cassette subfamily B protein
VRNFGYEEEGYQEKGMELALWKRIASYSRPFALPFGGALLLSLMVTGSALGLPLLMQRAIDGYITNTALPHADRISGVGWLALGYGMLVALQFATTFFQVILLEWIGQSIMHRLRQDLFLHLFSLDLGFFNRQPVGRLVTRLTNDIQNMHEMFTSVMVTVFNDLLRMLVILGLLIWMNLRLGLLLSLFVPLAFVVTWVFSRLARQQFRAIRKQLSLLNTFVQEMVSGMEIVQLFNRTSTQQRAFSEHNNEYLRRTLRQIRLFGTFMPLTELMHSLAMALILWYGGGEIIQQRLTLGELVAFSPICGFFSSPCASFPKNIP